VPSAFLGYRFSKQREVEDAARAALRSAEDDRRSRLEGRARVPELARTPRSAGGIAVEGRRLVAQRLLSASLLLTLLGASIVKISSRAREEVEAKRRGPLITGVVLRHETFFGRRHIVCPDHKMEATVRKRGITIPLNAGYAESNPRISRGSDGRVGRASRGRYSAPSRRSAPS
jgi:hypothetical protein